MFRILKVTEERSQIQGWIRIRYSYIRTAPKCHESLTFVKQIDVDFKYRYLPSRRKYPYVWKISVTLCSFINSPL